MLWDDFFEGLNEWTVRKAVDKISALSEMGEADEIVEAMNIIGSEDEQSAESLLKKALQFGTKFSGENLAEISFLCETESFRKALNQSASSFTSEDLEELYGFIDETMIVRIAKKWNLMLPEDLREYYEEVGDEEIVIDTGTVLESVEYALRCLYQVQETLKKSSKLGLIDMLSHKLLPSFLKYISLEEAEQELDNAKAALENMNYQLRCLTKNSNIIIADEKLKYEIDIWLDDSIMDYIVYRKIDKVKKEIRKSIKQVEAIRREIKAKR